MHTLNINDYRAIKEAKIRVDGITVLAGINGSGKSTLSRWLYYIINATHGFEHHIRTYFITGLSNEVEKVRRVLRSTPKANKYQSIIARLSTYGIGEELDYNDLRNTYFSFVNTAVEDLKEFISTRIDSKSIVDFLLEMEVNHEIDNQQFIDLFLDRCRRRFEESYNRYSERLENCSRNDLKNVIIHEYSEDELLPENLTFSEGKEFVVGESGFRAPLLLKRAIYIDSPMAVSGNSFYHHKKLWQSFNDYLYYINPERNVANTKELLSLIQYVIGGDVIQKEDQFRLGLELRYVNKSQGIDININDAATGIKTFAYVFQLLDNGWLDSETVLLIDEPEAHLHPQWIVEFARLLVMIHKRLKVKILIASHNPDMVAAIQSIAQKENIIDSTVFFLAEKDKPDAAYTFVDKGSDISDIFTSFNIALTRIDQYGN